MKRMILAGVLATAALVAGVANAATETFTATLAAPAGITSSGKGTGTFTFDTTTKALTYSVTYDGLTGPATMAHIHGPADPGANAGVQVPFANAAASPITGTATLTDAQVADLEAGKYYVNVHTAANRGGEIRGQLTKK
ncbi:MAG: CHRD domain-containing protein [Caulobacterales bacterium 68-7]|nr:CHRD domain-containing protein [Caulobacterales bacterium]OJU10367.1 MAG: CHRD domain-containing protein [Caulobacterales bacterium 68-7]